MFHQRAFLTTSSVFLAASSLIWTSAAAQTLASKSAEIGPPKRVTVMAAAMASPPPNAERYADEKQERLNDHHRPTIELVPSVGVLAERPVEAVPQTTVIGGPIRADSTLAILRQHALTDSETSDITSTVCEPSVAARGDEVLVTGNWFAAFSTNGGNSFTYVNPDSTFPSVAGGFCCDQVAIYDATHDVMFWYLQYVKNQGGNVGRLAVAKGDDIRNQRWRYYDFKPQDLGGQNEWLDFPDIALGDEYLYLTTNVFGTTSDQFTRAAVLRLPLQSMADYEGFEYRYYDTTQVASIRPTQGARETMYFGAHRNLSSIRVLTWPENSNSLNAVDVQIEAWSDETPVGPGPDGKDWLGRSDGRVTAAAVTSGQLAFAWTAAQDNTRPFPHVRVALIDKNSKSVTGQPHLWNENMAFAYPSFAPNAGETLGISVQFGGGTQFHASHAVGILEGTAWNLLTTRRGTNGPDPANRWGDYLAIRSHGRQRETWVASGFTLQGGSSRNNIEVEYIQFGKEGEKPIEPGSPDLREENERLRAKLNDLREGLRQLLETLERDEPASDTREPQDASEKPQDKPQEKPKDKPQDRPQGKPQGQPAARTSCCT